MISMFILITLGVVSLLAISAFGLLLTVVIVNHCYE